ncbi:MAG: SCO6880 family protein, partial [Acidimicrobiales bacterium]
TGMAEGRRYLFHPLERRGVVIGLQAPQLGALMIGVAFALLCLLVIPGGLGALAALTSLGTGAAAALWPVQGRPPVSWFPVVGRWAQRRRGGPRLAHRVPRTVRVGREGPWGLVDAGPAVGATGSGRPCRGGPARTTTPRGISLVEAPALPGDAPMGVVRDVHSGTWAAVLALRGRSLALLEPSDKERRLGAWGAILAGLARSGSPVQRVQWIETSAAGDAGELARYLDEAGVAAVDRHLEAARRSYEELIARSGPASQEHHVLLVLAVRPRHGRGAGDGKAERAAFDVLRRETRLLQGQLRNAELGASTPLTPEGLAMVLRTGVDAVGPQRPPGGIAAGAARAAAGVVAWPMATDEAWSAFRADGLWHATYWIAEWPRIEVAPDFMAPLLLCPGRRRVSLLMGPVPAERATRQIESARTADAADEELRRRAGFLSTARRQRQAEGVLKREAELADGHAEFRFSGYVTVSAATREDLESSCSQVEQAAQQAHLELRRLWGQQAEAFTWTQPLGRGLR